jgi:uncharacterized protein with beta-barrel porin domain
MKIETMNTMQNSFILERRSNSIGRLSSNGLKSDADSAVIGIESQQNLQLYDLNPISIVDDLSETVKNIQMFAKSGQGLDKIHNLDLERVMRLIGG